MKNVDVHLVSVGQGGLTLPNRDYYMEPEHAEICKEYEQYIVDMYELTGMDSEEAIDYINFNIEGAYIGKDTPVVVWQYHDE